jgi:S1-C subfamily serine protease
LLATGEIIQYKTSVCRFEHACLKPKRGSVVSNGYCSIMRFKGYYFGLATVFLVSSVFSCGSETSVTGSEEEIILSEVVEKLFSSALVIEGLACQKKTLGSGVAVEQGILTNAHVVAGTKDLYVIDQDKKKYAARIIALDIQTDLALLDIGDFYVPPLPVALPVEGTEGVALIGGEGIIKASPVIIEDLLNINISDIYGQGKYERKGMRLVATISQGDSGGAIINESGEVVGLVFSRSSKKKDISYAISSIEFDLVTQNPSLSGVESGECMR